MSDTSDRLRPPETCIVGVEPEDIGWKGFVSRCWTVVRPQSGLRAAILKCAKDAPLKFLSDGITWADQGRYSHNALKRHAWGLDARLSAGVSTWRFDDLATLPRELGYYLYKGNDQALENVWDTITWDLEVPYPPQPRPDPDPLSSDVPLEDDPPFFTVFGLLRLGLILLMRGSKLGQWLVDNRKDSSGYFCSELISKGFAETENVELVVLVEAGRVPTRFKPRRAVIEAMLTRSSPFGSETTHERVDAALFETQLTSIETAISDDGRSEMPVGYWQPGDEKPLFPPVLVTPNDLARSPSLEFVRSKSGLITDEDHDTIDPKLRARRGRQTRLALGVVALLVLAVPFFLVRAARELVS